MISSLKRAPLSRHQTDKALLKDESPISPCELKVLVFLRGDRRGVPLSAIGFAIAAPSLHLKRRTPQGMALFAGHFVRHLVKRGLVYPARPGYKISPAGEDYLHQMQSEEFR